jgi:hypothetical protein
MDYKTVLYKNSHLEPEIGRVVPMSTINQMFFGNSDPFCITGKLELINLSIITKINGIFYLNLDKVNEYFEIANNINFDNITFFPYNYFKNFKTTEVPEHFKNMMETMDEYLDYLTSINDHFSNTIKHIMYNKNFLNADLIVAKDDVFVVKFNKLGKPLFINFTYDLDTNGNFLSMAQPRSAIQYEQTFEFHKKQLLMEDPENFLITNLERVTGDRSFSEMAVKSYLQKNNFDTPIEGLCELVQWKDEKSQKEFIKFFIQKYPELVESSDSITSMMTNFEGFNKFLLTLDTSYVHWQVKEQINELYYQITHELIRSFELLYQNK